MVFRAMARKVLAGRMIPVTLARGRFWYELADHMNWRSVFVAAIALVTVLGAQPLSGEDPEIRGTATYREPVELPPEAVFVAALMDVSRMDVPAVELGRAEIVDPGPPPFEFAIPYDEALIDPRRSYAVRASVRIGDELRFTSDMLHPVFTRDAPQHVDVTMVMLSPRSGAFPALGAEPRVQMTQAGAVPAPADGAAPAQPEIDAVSRAAEAPRPTLQGMFSFDAEGAVFEDCATGATHPVATEGEFEALEHAYLAAGQDPGLPMMATFEGNLVLRPAPEDGDEREVVLVERFVGIWPDESCEHATSAPSLTNTYWKILSLGHSGLRTIDAQKEPHLVLLSDQPRFSATIGCNQMMGGYHLEGEALSFGEGAASTRMACPPPLQEWERRLAETIRETVSWRIDGDELVLIDAGGAILARLQADSPG
jgi:uncharacterized lipoprotein YbaY/heat shock protein HslJ